MNECRILAQMHSNEDVPQTRDECEQIVVRITTKPQKKSRSKQIYETIFQQLIAERMNDH